MTRNDVKDLIKTIMAAYPNYHPADITFTVDLWTTMLINYDSELVLVALKRYIVTDTSGFAPSIGQLIDEIDKARQAEAGPCQSGLEAWSEVSKAISDGYYHSEDEFKKLSTSIQKAIGSPENLRNWSLMPTEFVQSTVMPQFIRAYDTLQKREAENKKISEGIEEQIKHIAQEEENKMIKGKGKMPQIENRFNNFDQREYDWNELERQLFNL